MARKEVEANFIPSVDVCAFEADKNYYWKVVARQNNAADVTSDVNSFTVDAFRVISPENGATGCDDNLTVEWTAMGDVTYHVQISSQIDMSDVVYETDATASSIQILNMYCVAVLPTICRCRLKWMALLSKVPLSSLR